MTPNVPSVKRLALHDREFSSGDSMEIESDSPGGAGFLRAVRLLRIFRLFKVGRYSLGIRVFAGAIRMSMQAFVILLLTCTVTVIIFASLAWLVEQPSSSFVTTDLLEQTGRGDRSIVRQTGWRDSRWGARRARWGPQGGGRRLRHDG